MEELNITITHSFVNGKVDGVDATITRPSDWNANHVITPDTIANILSDHNKAAHDALSIDADTVDGSHAAAFAVAAKGVTNGDTHDHSGGDGAQVNHTTLSNIGTNTHAQIDTAIGTTLPGLVTTHAALTATHGVAKIAGITFGTYIGDGNQNRAIPHGLGSTPIYIRIIKTSGSWTFDSTSSTNMHYLTDSEGGNNTVTAWTDVNFYIGVSTDVDKGANKSGSTYAWFAFG